MYLWARIKSQILLKKNVEKVSNKKEELNYYLPWKEKKEKERLCSWWLVIFVIFILSHHCRYFYKSQDEDEVRYIANSQ